MNMSTPEPILLKDAHQLATSFKTQVVTIPMQRPQLLLLHLLVIYSIVMVLAVLSRKLLIMKIN